MMTLHQKINSISRKLQDVAKGPFADGIGEEIKNAIIDSNRRRFKSELAELKAELKNAQQREAREQFAKANSVLPQNFRLKTA